MQSKRSSLAASYNVGFALLFAAVIILTAVSTPPAQAQTFTTVYSFQGSADGAGPYWGVVFDAQGNLYGTTQEGGTRNSGTVFEVDTAGSEAVLHSFTGYPADGRHHCSGRRSQLRHVWLRSRVQSYSVAPAYVERARASLEENRRSNAQDILS